MDGVNKFEATARYNQGLGLALGIIHITGSHPRWDCPFFNDGYEVGRELRRLINIARDKSLESRGINVRIINKQP